MRSPGSATLWSVAVAVCLAWLPDAAVAQDLDNRSSENYEQVWFVPRFAGAVSLEGGLVQPLRLSTKSGYPTTWFAGIGWKHYLEPHGRLQLRAMATYEHGGVLNPALEGTANRVGGSLAVTARGISQQWFFGQLTAVVDGSLITLRPPRNPFGEGEGFTTGSQFGFGLETTFGSMFMLDPYLMGETGASVMFSRVEIGAVGTWELWGRWVVRFDLGMRRADRSPADYSSPTVSSP